MIAAIDPGPGQSALVVFDPGARRVVDAWLEPNHDVLDRLPDLPCGQLVIEWVVCYGRQVGQTTFQTARWIGRFEQHWIESTQGRSVHFLSNPEVRNATCGSPRAAERDVIYELTQKLGGKGTKKAPGPLYGMKSHLWSALAVAYAWSELHPG